MSTFDIVVPTTGRPSLGTLLERLAVAGAGRITVVDDRRDGPRLRVPAGVELLSSGGRGPAAARNVGWRATSAPWIAFLDDDVIVAADWGRRLAGELERAAPTTAATQGRVRVPQAGDRRPTDCERNVAALQDARWITADLAVRRTCSCGCRGNAPDQRLDELRRAQEGGCTRASAADRWSAALVSSDVRPVAPADWQALVRSRAARAAAGATMTYAVWRKPMRGVR